MKILLSMCALSLVLLAIPRAHAGEGGGTSVGGGGERFASHFATVGERLDDQYLQICSSKGSRNISICSHQRAFSTAFGRAKVLPRDTLLGPDGNPREAGPDGGNILLNVPLYMSRIETSASAEGTASVVAHEYMIQAGAESVDVYTQSAALIRTLKANFVDFSALVPPAPATDEPEDKDTRLIGWQDLIFQANGLSFSLYCDFETARLWCVKNGYTRAVTYECPVWDVLKRGPFPRWTTSLTEKDTETGKKVVPGYIPTNDGPVRSPVIGSPIPIQALTCDY